MAQRYRLCSATGLQIAKGLLDFIDIHQFIGYGIDGESGGSVNLKLVRDVAAVGGHGVHGKEELICYFLVAHTFGNAADNVFFSLSRQRVLSADDDIPDLETLDQRTVEALVLKSFDAESFEAEVRESKLFGR